MKVPFIISLDIYNADIHVFFGRKQFDRWEKKKTQGVESKIPKNWMSFFTRVFSPQKDGLFTLYRIIVIDPEELFLAASHESVHAILDLFDDLKIPFEYRNSEVFAYPVGYLAEKIIEHCIKNVDPKNEKV